MVRRLENKGKDEVILIIYIARATVDAQLAFDCLNSVSLRSTEAKALVEAVMPYVEWQSGKSKHSHNGCRMNR